MTVGLCECGCGGAAPIADHTERRKGWTKGQPKRFIQGHSGHRWQSPGYDVDPNSGCWNWKGYKRPGDKRAGAMRGRNGKHQIAYRFYYEREFGLVPEGLVLDHKCKNPSCVNPNHLEPVTQAVNLQRADVEQGADGRFQRKEAR